MLPSPSPVPSKKLTKTVNKNKKEQNKKEQKQCICPLCEDPILDAVGKKAGHNAVFCDGSCSYHVASPKMCRSHQIGAG